MAAQEKISAARLQRKVGSTLPVLLDAVEKTGGIARSAADAPEIDGVVHVKPHRSLKAGAFASVRITRADAHDLWGEVVPPAQ